MIRGALSSGAAFRRRTAPLPFAQEILPKVQAHLKAIETIKRSSGDFLQAGLAPSDIQRLSLLLCFDYVRRHCKYRRRLMKPLLNNAAMSAFRARRQLDFRRSVFQDGLAWKEVAAGKVAHKEPGGCIAIWRARRGSNSQPSASKADALSN